MSLKRQAAQGVFWAAASNWGAQVSGFLVFAVLSRLLQPEDFGLIALAVVFTAFTRLVAEQGLADAIVQRATVDREHLDTAFWANLAASIVLAAVLILTAPFIADLLDEPDLSPVLAWLSASIVLRGFSSVQRAILRRNLEFAKLTIRSLASVVVGGVAGIVAAFADYGVWSLVIQSLTTEVVGVAALWTVSSWRPGLRFSLSTLRGLLLFGVNVVGFRVLLFLSRRADDLLIGVVLGPVALGFYVVAYRFLRLMGNITTIVIGTVAFPVFSRLQEDRDRVRRAYYKAIRLTSLIAFPAFLGASVTAPEVIRLMFGSGWSDSVPVMQILALAGLVQAVLFAPGVVMKALGKPSWRLAIIALITTTNLVTFLIVVRHGIVWMAAAFTIVSYVLAPVTLMAARRLLDTDAKTLVRQIIAPLGASILMVGAVLISRHLTSDLDLVWRTSVLVGTGVVVYCSAILMLARPLALEAIELVRLAVPSRAESA